MHVMFSKIKWRILCSWLENHSVTFTLTFHSPLILSKIRATPPRPQSEAKTVSRLLGHSPMGQERAYKSPCLSTAQVCNSMYLQVPSFLDHFPAFLFVSRTKRWPKSSGWLQGTPACSCFTVLVWALVICPWQTIFTSQLWHLSPSSPRTDVQ